MRSTTKGIARSDYPLVEEGLAERAALVAVTRDERENGEQRSESHRDPGSQSAREEHPLPGKDDDADKGAAGCGHARQQRRKQQRWPVVVASGAREPLLRRDLIPSP